MSGATADIATALTELRSAVHNAHYPLHTPGMTAAQAERTALVDQLDDYLLPRLARLDAPLLVVVGGSTGAGKSTLVNSLVSSPISIAGVLRPTTRAPMLVSHPDDSQWFRGDSVLPGLRRITGAGHEATGEPPGPDPAEPPSDAPGTTGRHRAGVLHLVTSTVLAPGLAFLDAPDIDSIVDANRELAGELFAAADLWLFVTTAARYADAVPWELLHAAKERDVALAILLNRVPPESIGEVRAHLEQLLSDQGLAEEELFTLPEVELDEQGLLPPELVAPIKNWFTSLTRDAARRSAVVRRTMDGALRGIPNQVGKLVTTAEEQRAAAAEINAQVADAYASATATVIRDIGDGALLRGEVLARWQEFVGTGELLRALQSRVGRWRDRLTAALTGRHADSEPLREALTSGVAALIRAQALEASDAAVRAFRDQPQLSPAPRPVTVAQAERLVRDWQGWVLALVREKGAGKRSVARMAAYTVNATGLVVMVAVFTATSFIPTGAEVGVAAGTTVVGQKLLEAIFGDQAVRELANQAREDLERRVRELYADRQAALRLDVPIADPAVLRALARQVGRAHRSWREGS